MQAGDNAHFDPHTAEFVGNTPGNYIYCVQPFNRSLHKANQHSALAIVGKM